MISVMNLHFGKWDWFFHGFFKLGKKQWAQPQTKVKVSWNTNRRLQFGKVRSSMKEFWVSLPLGQETPLDVLPICQCGSSQANPCSGHKFHTQPCQWLPALNSTCIFVFHVSFTPPGLENSSIICLSLPFIPFIQSVTKISWSLIWNKSWISPNLYYFLSLN